MRVFLESEEWRGVERKELNGLWERNKHEMRTLFIAVFAWAEEVCVCTFFSQRITKPAERRHWQQLSWGRGPVDTDFWSENGN